MKTLAYRFAITLIAASFSAAVFADAPTHLPVQGMLFDNQDVAIDGTYDIQFSLYISDSTTSPVFRETIQDVTVDNGYFSVYLHNNAVTGHELDLSLFQLNGSLYLGIKVESDNEMTPRLQLGTAPYAAYSQHSDTATSFDGLTTGDVALASHSHILSDLPAELADGDDDTRPGTTCGGDQVLTWDGSVFSCVADEDTRPGATCGDQVLTWDGSAFSCVDDEDTRPGTACGDQVLTWDGSAFSCVPDNDTTPPTCSGVLAWNGSAYSCVATPASSCAQALNWNGTEFDCASMSSNTYSAASGGGLSLNGSEFSIATGGVTDSHITGPISVGKIATTGLDSDTLDGLDSSDLQPSYKTTVLVSPGATALVSGTNLLAAMDGITDATADKPYLLKIEPGVYDLGTESLVTKAYVDIEGSGEQVTTIASSGEQTITVSSTSTDTIEIRSLTSKIENSTHAYSYAFWCQSTSLKLRQVTAVAIGNNNSLPVSIRIALTVNNNSQVILSNFNAICEAPANQTIQCVVWNQSTGRMENSSVVVKGGDFGSSAGIGIDVNKVTDLTIRAVEVDLTGSGGSGYTSAIRCQGSSDPVVQSQVNIHNSRFSSFARAVRILSTRCTLNFAQSQIAGTVDGAVNCIGAYDANFTALDSTCQ